MRRRHVIGALVGVAAISFLAALALRSSPDAASYGSVIVEPLSETPRALPIGAAASSSVANRPPIGAPVSAHDLTFDKATVTTSTVVASGEVEIVPLATPSPEAALRRPLRNITGLRVWSNGDSTSYFMTTWFLRMAAELGAVGTQPGPEYHVSSGLSNPAYFDWPSYLRSEMEARRPDIVVFMVGANDAYAGMPVDEYGARVGAVMDLLKSPGRRVFWVGLPTMGRDDLAAAVPVVNAVFREQASMRSWVTYVDARAATAGVDGEFAPYLPDEFGTVQLVRADDGVHFTPEGGRRLALAVIDAILGSP